MIQTDTNNLLDAAFVNPDPMQQFQIWFNEAQQAGINMPEAMALATTSLEGKPSLRMVLMKGVDKQGFVFFTNYNSRKSKELLANPSTSLLFYWNSLERQVRIEGLAEQISAEESNVYFATRPRESQLSALISPQSAVVVSREELEQLWDEADKQYEGQQIPRPNFWGGFRVKPVRIEFWQGRIGRLHDRIVYQREQDGSWNRKRLAP